MAFSFTNLNSFVASVQSTIKNVESSIDQAMGVSTEPAIATAVTTNLGSKTIIESKNEEIALPNSTTDKSVSQFISSTAGDFFAAFPIDASTAKSPSKATSTSTPQKPSVVTSSPNQLGNGLQKARKSITTVKKLFSQPISPSISPSISPLDSPLTTANAGPIIHEKKVSNADNLKEDESHAILQTANEESNVSENIITAATPSTITVPIDIGIENVGKLENSQVTSNGTHSEDESKQKEQFPLSEITEVQSAPNAPNPSEGLLESSNQPSSHDHENGLPINSDTVDKPVSNYITELQSRLKVLEMKEAEYIDLKQQFDSSAGALTYALANEKERNATLTEELQRWRKKGNDSESANLLLQAKDAQIEAVLKEGQQLMAKQQNLETIVKKLRKEMVEKDNEAERLRNDINSKEARVTALTESLSNEKESVRKQTERVNELTQLQQESLETITSLRNQVRPLEANVAEIEFMNLKLKEEKQALETSCSTLQQELSMLTRTKFETQERLELLKSDNMSAGAREEQFLRTVTDLQNALRAAEDSHSLAQQNSEAEVRALRDAVRRAEERSEELVSSVPQATRPLLRQIEGLQQSLNAQNEAWTKTESNLRQRAKESEMAAIRARNERNEWEEKCTRAEYTVADVRMQLTQFKEKYTKLELEVRQNDKAHEEVRQKLRDAEAQLAAAEAETSSLRHEQQAIQTQLQNVRSDRSSHEARLEAAIRTEKSARERLEAQLHELRQNRMQPPSLVSTPHSTSSTPKSFFDPYSRSSSDSSSNMPDIASSSHSPLESVDSFLSNFHSDHTAIHSSLEMLRALVRQREGELIAVREQLARAEALRNTLANEVASLEAARRVDAALIARLPELELQLQQTTARYDVALQLIGEKEEELDELKEDLLSVKATFRMQIEQLLTSAANQSTTSTPKNNLPS